MLRAVAFRLPVLICTDVSTDKLQHPIRRFRLQVPCFPKSPSFGLLSPAQPAVLPSQPCVPQILLVSGHGYTAERDLNAVPNLAGLGRHSSRNAFYGAPGLPCRGRFVCHLLGSELRACALAQNQTRSQTHSRSDPVQLSYPDSNSLVSIRDHIRGTGARSDPAET